MDAFGLFDAAQQDSLDDASRAPALSVDETPTQAYALASDANDRFGGMLSAQRNFADAAQDALDAFQARTGEKLPNPYAGATDPLTNDVGQDMSELDYVQQRFAAKAQELADPSLVFPDQQTLYQQSLQKARQALDAQAQQSQGQTEFGTGLASAAAGFTSQFKDPGDLALNALAIATMPEGGGLVRSLLGSAAAFGGQDLAQQAATYGFRQAVVPAYGPGDVAESVASSALGGAALEGAGKALGALWRGFRFSDPEAAAAMPLASQDAGNAAERVADIDANNPFRTGLSGEDANNAASVQIERDILADHEPTLPPSAEAELQARTGDVFAPQEPSPAEVIERHAIANNPDLYARVGSVEGDIAQARGALNEIEGPQEAASPFGAIPSRIDDLQQQLSQITGKRRSSPRAKGLRAQIADLQSQSDALDQGATQSDADRANLLRQRLVDLQSQRAQLGPDVFTARKASAEALGIPLDDEQALDSSPSHSGRMYQGPEPADQAVGAQTAQNDLSADPNFAAPLQEPDVSTQAPNSPEGAIAKGKSARSKKASSEPLTQQAPLTQKPVKPLSEPSAREIARARRMAANDANAGQSPRETFFGNQAIRVRYELAEAGDLITSHDSNFTPNPAFPENLQPRDRSSAAARDQVLSMGSSLNPERLGPSVEANAGAPIVGPDGVVESGNGRTLAIRQAYASGRDGPYRAFLARQGFDPTGFREPILIGRRVSKLDPEAREAFVHAANGSASLRMSATEQALSDARHISPEIADYLKPGDVDSLANRDFVRALVAKMPAGERGGMLTREGSLSANGVRRVQAALVARAYGDPGVVARAFDHPDPNIKTIAAALTGAAPDWIRMRDAVTRGEIASGQDITPDILTAVRAIMRARDERRPVGEIMNQTDLFASDVSQMAARLFFKDNRMDRFLSKQAMRENLETFSHSMLEQRGRGSDLFGEPPPNTGEALRATVRRSDDRIAAISDALKPEAIAKAFDDPKVQAAAERDLQRAIETGRNRVPALDAEGNPTLGFADAELEDINRQADLAREISACNTPMSEAAE